MSLPTILALETSCFHGSLWIGRPDGARFETFAQQSWEAHARTGALFSALASTQVHWRGADLIAVGIGPGSFSGIRVSIAAALGIRAVRPIPWLGIPSADAVGRNLSQVTRLGVFADAKRNEYYLTVFQRGQRIRGPLTVPVDQVDDQLEKLTLAVSAEPLAAIPTRAVPTAATLAQLAWDRWRETPRGDDQIEPIYLRGAAIGITH